MKKQTIAGVILMIALLVTSGGWFMSNDKNQELIEIIVDKNETIEQKSTEIANLDDVIVLKDEKLEAEQTVIEKQKDQLQKNEKTNKSQKKLLKSKDEEIKKLKAQVKKKPKVVEKVKVVEKIVYKEKSNFNKSAKGSDVAKPQAKVATVKKPVTTSKPKATAQGKGIGTFSMTSYTAGCAGCSGITATGIDVRGTSTYQGYRIIAVDPNVIPLWSIVRVNTGSSSFTAIALDTGGAIKGSKIDFLVGSHSEAIANGRQSVSIEMVRRGK